MKRLNAYSMDIYDYNLEHGTDIFLEYKSESTTDERRKEIEDWMFNLMREKDIIPITILDEASEREDLISLSDRTMENSYDFENGDYLTYPVGVTFLNKFFGELLCNVHKVGSSMSVSEGFHNDNMLRKVIRKSLTYSSDEMNMISWFYLGGCGFCSNFRPAAAKALYEIFGKPKDCKVFDSSAGYGARMLGAHFAQNVTEYLGIDPNTADKCQEEIAFLDGDYDTNTKKTVLKMGSEDFTPEAFPQYQRYFDLYFTSPPYFNTEKYSDDESQSWKKFPTYAGWITGFYQSTINNACSALKEDGIFSINIFEKIPNIKDLTKLFLANNGWYVYKTDKYLLRTMPGRSKGDDGEVKTRTREKYSNFEPIWYAKHYTQLLKEGLITEEQAEEYKNRVVTE